MSFARAGKRLVAAAYQRIAPWLAAGLRPGTRLGQPWPALEARGILPIPLHYYHPYAAARGLEEQGFWGRRSALPGVRIDLDAAAARLRDLGRRWGQECAWPDHAGDPGTYSGTNPTFGFASAAVAHAMVREHRPRRVLEVGSGSSTLVLAGALEKNRADGAPGELWSIDPYPGEILRQPIAGLTRRLDQEVERTALEEFLSLRPDDLLFIDSSHVIRYGGDVLFLFLEVLPRLAPGVLVHVHDVHLPEAYPREYFERHRWAWNEQYLLQALLAGGDRFEVLLPCWWIHLDRPQDFAAAFPHHDPSRHRAGSSFWLRSRD